MKFSTVKPILVSCALWLAGPAAMSAAALDNLTNDSPFLPRDGSPSVNAAVEFRGLLVRADGVYFGLYDRDTRTAAWVRQGDPSAGRNDFKVNDYRPRDETAQITRGAWSYTARLATATVAVSRPLPGGGG